MEIKNLIFLIIIVLTVILMLLTYINNKEGFVSGLEGEVARYDQIYPLDDPRYTTPQQKEFQMAMSEHSALDPNMQFRRKDIQTQFCKVGEKCFDTQEYHELNYKTKSAPDIINSKIGYQPHPRPCTRYLGHEEAPVLGSNAYNNEMRADLYQDVVLPDLFFEHLDTCETSMSN